MMVKNITEDNFPELKKNLSILLKWVPQIPGKTSEKRAIPR